MLGLGSKGRGGELPPLQSSEHAHSSLQNIFLFCQIVFSERGEIISAGNFHGEYPAKAADYLAIAIHEMAAMSERRIERLVNPGKLKF